MSDTKDQVDDLIHRGHALEDAGRFSEARALYQAAAELAPGEPRPLLNLGNAWRGEGNVAQAIAVTRRAVALVPHFAPASFNLGLLLRQSGAVEEAESALRAAVTADPAFADAAIALADLLHDQGLVEPARRELERAMQANPSRAAPPFNLAVACIARDDLDAAEALLQRAAGVEPGFAPTFGALGNVRFRGRRAREAEPYYRTALARMPTARDTAAGLLFSLLARDDLSAEQIFQMHREVAGPLTRAGTIAAPQAGRNVARRRLRVGYLSPDFRTHAVALFIRPVLRCHDRGTFEVFCYDSGRDENSVTTMFRGLAEHWRNIAALSDTEAVATIRRDDLDLLIDLAGYTAGSRVWLLADRCAQVQATWLGYLHSTALAGVDVRITDRFTDPPGTTEHLHTERLARLPNSQWCYDPMHQPARSSVVRAARPHIEFGSFNQFWKITDACLDRWSAILRGVPEARLRVVGVPAGRAASALRERFAAAGVDEGRITLMPRLDVGRYFHTLDEVDIALDTQPYNGATTTLDSLSRGVPVVALAGDRSVGRSGVSILQTLGMPELIAADPDAYLALNVRLARDSAWLATLRAELPRRLQASPLMDATGFTRDYEALLRELAHA